MTALATPPLAPPVLSPETRRARRQNRLAWIARHSIAIVLTIMFATPVVYPLHAVPAAWRGWYVLNPMVGIVEGFRQALLGLPLDFGPLAVAAAVTLIVLPVAYLYFKHVESTVADVL